MNRRRNLESCLAIATGFVILGLIFKKDIFYYISFSVGLIGLIISPLAEIIHKLWMKLAEILSFISSKILLTIIYYVVLYPLAILYKISNRKNIASFKKHQKSTWKERNYTFKSNDLENIW